MRDLSISFDEWGEFRVRANLTPEETRTISERARSSADFWLFDDVDGYLIFEGRRRPVYFVGVGGSQLEVSGIAGRDDLDYTSAPTELSLDDRLAVARLIRNLVGARQ